MDGPTKRMLVGRKELELKFGRTCLWMHELFGYDSLNEGIYIEMIRYKRKICISALFVIFKTREKVDLMLYRCGLEMNKRAEITPKRIFLFFIKFKFILFEFSVVQMIHHLSYPRERHLKINSGN